MTKPVDPNAKYEHPLFWPEPMLDFIQQHATRCDKSLSFIVQFSWTTAYPRISGAQREALESAIRPYAGAKRKQSLFYTGAMITQFAEQAKRLDSSESLVVQAAVALARAEIEELPPDDGSGVD